MRKRWFGFPPASFDDVATKISLPSPLGIGQSYETAFESVICCTLPANAVEAVAQRTKRTVARFIGTSPGVNRLPRLAVVLPPWSAVSIEIRRESLFSRTREPIRGV